MGSSVPLGDVVVLDLPPSLVAIAAIVAAEVEVGRCKEPYVEENRYLPWV